QARGDFPEGHHGVGEGVALSSPSPACGGGRGGGSHLLGVGGGPLAPSRRASLVALPRKREREKKQRQSTFAPDTFTTSAHFGSSLARNAAKSDGVPSLATALIFSRLVFASADCSP